jgi:hypothetical protein
MLECRVYAKRKFHAKAYITRPKVSVIGSVALVGSSLIKQRAGDAEEQNPKSGE